MTLYFVDSLKARLERRLKQSDFHPKSEAERQLRFQILDKCVRRLAQQLREASERREQAGYSIWRPLATAGIGALAIVIFAHYHSKHGLVSYGHADGSPGGDVVRILKKYDARNFKFQWVRTETDHGRTVDFKPLPLCEDMADWDAGETFLFFIYREKSGCIEVLEPHEEVGYAFVRDDQGREVHSRNCPRIEIGEGKTAVVCSPKLNEAKFEGEN